MEDLVIDAKSIIEWLESRRKLKPDWPQKSKAIELKSKEIVEYLKTLNVREIKANLDNYNDNTNLTIIDFEEMLQGQIKSSEGQQKNFFGNYSAKSIKDVQALIKLMVRDNLNCVSLSKKINQILKFERPSIYKNIESFEGEINYSQNKIVQLANSFDSINSQKKAFLEKLGFGEDVDFELKMNEFVCSLPEKISKILELLENNECQFYLKIYYEHIGIMNPKLPFKSYRLNVLEYQLKKGDCEKNAYENNLKEQLVDQSIESSWTNIGSSQLTTLGKSDIDCNSNKKYDYEKMLRQKGYFVQQAQYGFAANQQTEKPSEINWDFEITEETATEQPIAQNDIKWDFEITESTAIDQGITEVGTKNEDTYNFDIVEEFVIEEVEEDLPIGESILCNRLLREQFLAEIYEILNFFEEKKCEVSGTHTSVLKNYDSEYMNNEFLQKQTEAQVENGLKYFEELKVMMNNYQLRQILALLESSRAKQRIIDTLTGYNNSISKNQRASKNYATQIEELKSSIAESRKSVKKLLDELNKYCKKSETIISELVKRRVIITKPKN